MKTGARVCDPQQFRNQNHAVVLRLTEPRSISEPRGERGAEKGRQGNAAVDEKLSRNNVAQTFLSASFGDFPVANLCAGNCWRPIKDTGQECPLNPQTRMSALRSSRGVTVGLETAVKEMLRLMKNILDQRLDAYFFKRSKNPESWT